MILKMKKPCELHLNALLLRDDTIIVFLIKQNCCRGIEPFLYFYCQAEFGYTNNIAIENKRSPSAYNAGVGLGDPEGDWERSVHDGPCITPMDDACILREERLLMIG